MFTQAPKVFFVKEQTRTIFGDRYDVVSLFRSQKSRRQSRREDENEERPLEITVAAMSKSWARRKTPHSRAASIAR
ncbi:MAG: hypothetical protein AB7K64_22275 [Variibacter sp.]